MKTAIIRFKNVVLNLSSLFIIFVAFVFSRIWSNKKEIVEIHKVTWFGAYGNGNLGDDLIFFSLKRLLSKNGFDIRLSIRDFKKAKSYGVSLFSKGEQVYDFWRYLDLIRNSDAIFLGGGGLLEYYYPSKQAYRMIIIYLCPLMIAKVFRKPTFVFGIGVNSDKIENPAVRLIYRMVLSSCEIIVTRDEKSKTGLLRNGVNTKIESSFDPVLSLDFKSLKKKPKKSDNKKRIGILLWPYFLWPHFYDYSGNIGFEKQGKHRIFKEKIKELICLLEQEFNVEALTFHFSDTLLYKELDVVYNKDASLMDFLRKTASVDLLISMRYHGLITGLLFESPVISISVQQKMDALMKNYDLKEYNHSALNFDPQQIFKQTVSLLTSDKSQVVAQIRDRNGVVKTGIRRAYEGIDF